MSRFAFSEDQMRAFLLAHRQITSSGCWEYTGTIQSLGYGRVWWRRVPWFVHRLAWHLFKGPIPDGKLILHHCDNPPCFNFETDLYVGTTLENIRDRGRRGRTAAGETHYCARLDLETVKLIRRLYADGIKQTELARRFGIGQPAVSALILRKTWKVDDAQDSSI